MAAFEDSAHKYQTIRMERREGILQMTFHTNGDSLQWGALPHGEFSQAFRDVGSDPDNRVVIMTGTGAAFSGPPAMAAASAHMLLAFSHYYATLQTVLLRGLRRQPGPW
jgi:enoyl-CoA hydratase/carnithine racemase